MENPKDAPAASSASPQAVDEVPDPEDDDLDELDDMLDEFSATKLDTKQDGPTASGPGRPATSSLGQGVEEIPDDFNKQLQEQMASLLGEIDESPEMRQQMEAMMKELGAGGEIVPPEEGAHVTAKSGAAVGASTAPEETFQETIRKTMERMQASGEQATAAATSDEGADILAQMLQQMQGEGMDGAGEEDFSKMLMGMMEQLTNKEILYEPMKELHDKYPDWMSKNRAKTPKEDLERYEEQQRLVGEIVGRFEGKGYSDDNAADREFIVERMQKMQAAGSPPAGLVGDMKDAQDALGDLDQGCPQQ
ncbi:Peroxisome chaperone and import receptor [Xylographa opegraphella]|nr:Peroxisome chaperone and import receptor [Xylographa opegraphella]